MSLPTLLTGFVRGTGAAINVSCGFIPDKVQLWNITDGDSVDVWFRARIMAFTSGGTHEIAPGDRLQGATNTHIRARVRHVILTSGTWAAGNAAGDIIFDVLDENGTFGSENVDLLDPSGGPGVSIANVGTVTAQAEKANFNIAAAVAGQTPANGILPYVGTRAGVGAGFTISASRSESGKLFVWEATRVGAFA
jgi:hypothetical protein